MDIIILCRECGGRMEKSTALINIVEPRVSIPDFPGLDSPGKIPKGQTFTYEQVGNKHVTVLKCIDCGHSFTPDEEP